MNGSWRSILLTAATGGFGIALALGMAWYFSAERVRTVQVGGVALEARVADSPSEWMQGLSDTPADLSLPQRSMLFLFPQAVPQTFWMKDMRYPLDVYWFAGDQLLGVSRNLPAPHAGEDPAMMSSPAPADRVLEVPAGTPVQF